MAAAPNTYSKAGTTLPWAPGVVRKHRSMATCVVDVDEGGRAVTWAQGLVPNLVSRIGVMGELISRCYYCA
jgi:hypothetical protein